MNNTRLALLFFVLTLGLYAGALYLWPRLEIWVPSDVYHVVILAFPLGLVAWHRENRRTLGLARGRWRFGIVAMCSLTVIAFLAYWLADRHFTPQKVDHVLFATVVWGPAAEEILFRGYLQPKLEGIGGRWPGLAATAVLFGISHLPRIYLREAAPVVLVPEAIALGLAFGWMRDRTGSIYYGALSHMAYNLIVTTV